MKQKINDKKIYELIKNKDLKKALDEMEQQLKKVLINKLNKSEEKSFNSTTNIMDVIEYCIKTKPEYYDILTYLRNILFFEDKTDLEKIYELAYIYDNLNQ